MLCQETVFPPGSGLCAMQCCSKTVCCLCLARIAGARIAKRCPACLTELEEWVLLASTAAMAASRERERQIRGAALELLQGSLASGGAGSASKRGTPK